MQKKENKLSSSECLCLVEGDAEESFQISKTEVKCPSLAVIQIAAGTGAQLFIALMLLNCLWKLQMAERHCLRLPFSYLLLSLNT